MRSIMVVCGLGLMVAAPCQAQNPATQRLPVATVTRMRLEVARTIRARQPKRLGATTPQARRAPNGTTSAASRPDVMVFVPRPPKSTP
jgi:hypothetical protein